ncbi:MAG: prenyltransferase [Acidimicrobiales bacterium]|jgi:hypothetical protein
MHQPESTEVLALADIEQTAESIAQLQLSNGMILWTPGGHTDPWNHIEAAMALTVAGRIAEAEAAYLWLHRIQGPQGTWHHYYVEEGVEEAKIDTNCCAYIATGVLHYWLITGDDQFAEMMWSTVDRALDFVVGLQSASGLIPWAVHSDGKPWPYALLTGSSSIHHSLLAGLELAERLGHDRPLWELAAVRLGEAIAHDEAAFEPKKRWAMDWYYPVLSGALGDEAAAARLEDGRETFVLGEHGIRCVGDQPWVTAAETCECAMAYLSLADLDSSLAVEARRLFDAVRIHRQQDGAYLTGLVYPGDISFPDNECSTYTSAAIILAADALDRRTPASGLLIGDGLRDLRRR